MAELTIGQLIKIIVGLFVVVAVVAGLYLFFKSNVLGFFQNLPGANGSEIILSLIK
jgi:uncharacterized iron-regulated membrane protein